MSRPRERGVVLLAAVTALAVMTVLALGLARSAVLDQRTTGDALATLQADALLRSGVAAAAVVLGEAGAADAPDTLRAPWLQPTGHHALGAGWVDVELEDEARRLDLNEPALAPALPRLLAVLGLDPAIADAIADWKDADDLVRPHGAERGFYLTGTPPTMPANGPFLTLGELTLVRGVGAAGLERLRQHVTVAGEHAINPNTASRAVLLAVLDDTAAVERVLAARERAPLDTDALAALLPDMSAEQRTLLVPRGQRYTARVVATVGTVRRVVEATLWSPAGAQVEVVAWRPLSGSPIADEPERDR